HRKDSSHRGAVFLVKVRRYVAKQSALFVGEQWSARRDQQIERRQEMMTVLGYLQQLAQGGRHNMPHVDIVSSDEFDVVLRVQDGGVQDHVGDEQRVRETLLAAVTEVEGEDREIPRAPRKGEQFFSRRE